jgi:hypothetical protein
MKFLPLSFLLLAGLASCSDNAKKEQVTPPVMKTYLSDSLHVGFSYPENWEVKTNGSHVGVFEFLEDSTDKFQENIVMWTEDMPLEISDSLYSKAAIAELKIKNPFLSVQALPVKKMGELTFYPFEFNFFNANSTHFFIKGYTLVKGKRGYNFSCTSKNDKAAQHASLFETILTSFQPL